MNTRLVLALLFILTLASCATNDVEEVLEVIEEVGEVLEEVGEVGKIVGCKKNPSGNGCPAAPPAGQ